MKDDTQETGRHGRYFQYAVFALAALLVASLGFVLIPRQPPPPAAPPFSEQARASAFADSLTLRAAGLDLVDTAGATAPAPQAAALSRVVTLLTVQARALMLPADAAGDPALDGAPTDAATALATTPPTDTPPSTTADLAAALQSSGAQRLQDAETADGGMARLLAGAGTAQLLAAEELASAAGIALAPLPVAGPSSPASPAAPTPATATAAASCASEAAIADASTGADLGLALASAVAGELELVYAYQAALTRLNSGSAAPASNFLAQHGVLRSEAEAMGRSRCAAVPLRQPGYALSQAFLADPAAGLGTLEAETLPVLGDVVALSEGPERAWALSALQSAVRRTVHWGASPGPVPGLVLDETLLPPLPEPVSIPGTSTTSTPGNS
ncbi:DUF4439 domain-containing protein [Pseudarthrobacter sp. AL07]|uniref:DUF4439 domain-containing protein n=1 Tax=unclassified Pseudarthrobacter TaxID=2647000 RepID=UPI00249AFFC2|nr:MULTISPECIES: DUF4439 domain-containing protein [unclassified Pseudarthrobacter]MDI3193297.1 DUF4439 domain-containing protein [Pseudarthrobacter sp. AL20]MDI3207365.1 DUF4439 domain-containing protein [Pseudarthrobacter sp. AL07]